jgi:putative selenate reductase FAD-binding subunit
MIEQFHQPTTVRQALALKKRFQGRAVFLAGGTHLNSNECDLRPEHYISLAGLGLDRIESRPGLISIGALCTLQRLADDRKVPAALKLAAAQLVNRNVRNMATIGGHVAANLRHSNLIPMLVALDAKLGLLRVGATKMMSVADYVSAPPAGLITKVVVPRLKPGRVAACRSLRASANARSIVTTAVSMTLVKNEVRNPIVALGGVTRHVVRLTAVEDALEGRPLPEADELQALVSRSVRPVAALAGSAAFLKYEAGVVVALALQDARRQKAARP